MTLTLIQNGPNDVTITIDIPCSKDTLPQLSQQGDAPWQQRERRGPRTSLQPRRNSSRCRDHDEI